MWCQDECDFGAVPGFIRAQSVPGLDKVNNKGLP
jgi:hypothetical protein